MSYCEEDCDEAPLRIDYVKLLTHKHDYTPITHYQLAWLHAVLEGYFTRINLIDWDNPDLSPRAYEIEAFFRMILEEKIYEYLEIEDGKKETLWDQIGIVKQENECVTENNTPPEYLISLATVIKLLRAVATRFHCADKSPNELIEKYKQSEDAVRHYYLDRTDIRNEFLTNLSSYCTGNPEILDLNKLPKFMWLKHFAGYVAISLRKFPNGLIQFDELWFDSMSRIHIDLRKALDKKLNFTLRRFDEMHPEQCKIAKDAGIVDIAFVAFNPKRILLDNLSCRVSRELALQLLRVLPGYSFLCNEPVQPISTYVSLLNDFSSYAGDEINIAVVQHILPELAHEKKQNITKEELAALSWHCFEKLEDVLTKNGSSVNLISASNKKDHEIKGTGRSNESIEISFDAFRQRFLKLYSAYIFNIPPKKIHY
jgi:hypothetical protein